METVLIVIQLIIAIALIGCVLMQRTAQDGGGLMGGSSTMGGLFTARGSANLLTRATAILATAFMVMSLVLGIVAGHSGKPRSIADQIEQVAPQQGQSEQKSEAPKAAPSVPLEK